MPIQHARGVTVVGVFVSAVAGSAAAEDLVVADIDVTQAVQYGDTPLIAENVTYTRVLVDVVGGTVARDVDALLHVYADGNEVDWSPLRSINGPIVVNRDADQIDLDAWLNFQFVAPVGAVDLEVVLDPLNLVAETDDGNNTGVVLGLEFACRDVVDIAYVPIDYQFDGSGLPEPALIEPGIGDGFVRAVFTVGEWSYYESPLPVFTWEQEVNETDIELLNALQDIRINQLPGAGFRQPDFVFGWLPGNPHAANGRAIGIPGDVAFGNTDPTRHQRTFAHELGHLMGLPHNSNAIEIVGLDTEHHLFDTQGLDQVFPPDLMDVMTAGLLTHEAFVNGNTYQTALHDPRVLCGGPAASPEVPVLRVCGSFDGVTGETILDPVMWIERGIPTTPAPGADLMILSKGGGAQLAAVGVVTGTTERLCVRHGEQPAHSSRSSFYALVPATDPEAIEVLDLDGNVLASRRRSDSPPVVTLTHVDTAATPDDREGVVVPGGPLTGPVTVSWTASDADGDELVFNLLYSFNGGGAWLPLGLGLTETTITFDASRVPASLDGDGRLRVVASDGLANSVNEMGGIPLGANAAPAVDLITPNGETVHALASPIAFHASVWDREDFYLDDELVTWISDMDGVIGSGRLMVTDNLRTGDHLITVRAQDGAGDIATDTVAITVLPRDVFDADVNDDGLINLEDLVHILTEWGPCESGPDECVADVTGDSNVDVEDLVEVLLAWGT